MATDTEYMRGYRRRLGGRTIADKAQARAANAAVRYVRTKHPRVWRRLLAEAYETLGATPRTAGRPPRPSPGAADR